VASRTDWAAAYYRQAAAEWDFFREVQARPDVAPCFALHLLQMATEKLAKAYRFRDTTTAEAVLLSSHVGFAAFLNNFLHSPPIHRAYANRSEQLALLRHRCGHLARLVEQLAPAVGGPTRPENTEYPWDDGGDVVAPVDFAFPNLDLRNGPHARALLNFIQLAFEAFEGEES
jgi:hypothetical protein